MVNFGVRQSRPKCLIWRQDLNGSTYYMLGISHFTPGMKTIIPRRFRSRCCCHTEEKLLSIQNTYALCSESFMQTRRRGICTMSAAPREKMRDLSIIYKRLAYITFFLLHSCASLPASLHGFANQNQRREIHKRKTFCIIL